MEEGSQNKHQKKCGGPPPSLLNGGKRAENNKNVCYKRDNGKCNAQMERISNLKADCAVSATYIQNCNTTNDRIPKRRGVGVLLRCC